MKKILIIAGEASSDYHASLLVKAIKNLDPEVSFFGLGGNDMQKAGVEIIHNILDLAVIGPVDLVKNYSKLKKAFNDLCEKAEKTKPDCAILIDYPSFNLRVAQRLKKINIPIIYYISPQVWAWGKSRIKKIKKLVDKMLVIFDFEENLYKQAGVNVKFVGHPLLDEVKKTKSKKEFLKEYGLDENKITIGLLPGSRLKEISRILPVMIKSAEIIYNDMGQDNIQFVLPAAKTLKINIINDIISNSTFKKITVVQNETYNALSCCSIAMVASGTAILESALLELPMALVYKVSFLMYMLSRIIIKIPYIGIVNVIANEKIIPEFVQKQAKPSLIAGYLMSLIRNKDELDKVKLKLSAIRQRLGAPGASQRAADEILKFLQNR